ncbi:MAG: hypothetical protein KF830_11870 [Planctomycetes bacterium]|nr:hypothetical protein [Planctomycetota bacterium]
MHDGEPDRAEALALLDLFCRRLLPGLLRRIATWKQLGRGELPELAEDVRQELALDCLQHAAVVRALPATARHARWMRLAERWVYRQRVRPRIPPARPAGLPAPIGNGEETALPEVPGGVRLGNGRWNLTASAVREGRPLGAMQRQLEQLASQLGGDDGFWRARLAEALAGLAADLLQERGGLHVLYDLTPPARQRRLRRLRALRRRFHVRPSTIDVRRAVRRWTQAAHLDAAAAPLRLLEDAVQLWPASSVAWLWLAEACLGEGDLRGALAAVRSHRRLGVPPRGRAVLLRARVLEARGRWSAAVRLLRRAAHRWPHEGRLRQALARITD